MAKKIGLEKVIIDIPVDICSRVALPREYTIEFYEKGLFNLQTTIFFNSTIVANRKQIFHFKNLNAEVLANKISVGHSTEGYFSSHHDVFPEWFGAIGDAFPSNAYNSEGFYAPTRGHDDTLCL